MKINLNHQKIKFPMILMKSDVLKSFWKITKTKLVIYFLRFRSKSDPDPHTSIFDRFRRARALSPSQRLCSIVIKGHGHSEIGENGLRWSDRVRRPRWDMYCVITWRTTETKIKTKRLQMSHKRLVLGLSVCKMYFSRTQSPPTPPNSQK